MENLFSETVLDFPENHVQEQGHNINNDQGHSSQKINALFQLTPIVYFCIVIIVTEKIFFLVFSKNARKLSDSLQKIDEHNHNI